MVFVAVVTAAETAASVSPAYVQASSFDYSILADVDAFLNGVTTLLIITGLAAIKRGLVELDQDSVGVSYVYAVGLPLVLVKDSNGPASAYPLAMSSSARAFTSLTPKDMSDLSYINNDAIE